MHTHQELLALKEIFYKHNILHIQLKNLKFNKHACLLLKNNCHIRYETNIWQKFLIVNKLRLPSVLRCHISGQQTTVKIKLWHESNYVNHGNEPTYLDVDVIFHNSLQAV